jgi:hypothetical protein
MVTGFVTLIGTLLSIMFWIMKRHAQQADDPRVQNQKRYAQIDQDILGRDSVPASVHALDDLDELDRLQNASASH